MQSKLAYTAHSLLLWGGGLRFSIRASPLHFTDMWPLWGRCNRGWASDAIWPSRQSSGSPRPSSPAPCCCFSRPKRYVHICRLLPGERNNILSLSLSFYHSASFYCPQGAGNQAEQLTHRLLLRVARWSDQFLQARIFVSMTESKDGRMEGRKEGHMRVVCCIRNCIGP